MSEVYKNVEMVKDISTLINKYIKEKYVLDIGCANYIGEDSFGKIHQEVLNSCSKCIGIDLSESVYQLPRNDKAKYFQANAEEFITDEKIDFIFMGDVIEHTSNPGLSIEKISKMIHNTDAEALIITPNPYGFRNLVGLLFDYEPAIHPEHTMLLTPLSFNELISRFDLKIKKVYYIKGQIFQKGEKLHTKFYKIIYRIVLSLLGKKYSDTIGFVIGK